MSTVRRALLALAGAVGLVLLAGPIAGAVDMWGNVAPASQLPPGSLIDAYPIANFALDHHFSALEAGVFSGVDVSGLAPTVAWLLASLVWQLTVLLAVAVISLFTFAFSLDLVNGSAATGGTGALQPVAEAVRSIYRDVFGGPWLTVAVLLAGMWSMWNALVRRRYTETAGALAISLLCIVIALAFVTQPERTIGTVSKWTNTVSESFLSVTTEGTVGGHEQAKGNAADHLFELFVYRPWVVLQFGGLEHCARDGEEVRVRPLASDPGRDLQLARRLARSEQIDAENKQCVNNRLKYAPHFLRFDSGSDERKAEYEALKAGDSDKLPDADPGKRDGSHQLSDLDKPAAEAMGKSAQFQRLGLALLIFAGELGGYLLLGSIAVSVILAQVLALLLLAFAPVALVVGTFPGRGHQFFADWLTRLVTFLVKKAVYSLILAVLLAVSVALQDATSSLGWLMAWGLQAVYFWVVFLQRRQLVGGLTNTLTGTSGQRDETRLLAGLAAGYAFARVLKNKLPSPRRTGPPRRDEPRRTEDGRPMPVGPAPISPDRRDDRNDDGERHDDPEPGPGSRPERHGGGAAGRDERERDGGAEPDAASAAPPPPDERERTSSQQGSAPSDRDRGDTPPARPPQPEGGERPPIGGDDAERPRPLAPRPPERDGGEQPTGTDATTQPRRPAPAQGEEAAAERSRSPLRDGLRADAARVHHDAVRLHHDAQRHDAEASPARAPSLPLAPRRPTGPKGGERS